MQIIRKCFGIAATCAVIAIGSIAQAEQINTNGQNIALDGYDPVAYFTQSRPVVGASEFQSEWQDAIWQFASAEHQSMFEESPEKYAPRYGGFCAGAMSVKGYKAEIDPQYWMIVDGQLFLGGEQRAMDHFDTDASAKFNQADENWKVIN